jgi:DNA repair exonuclease SbcCD nuclease subunit
MSRFIYLSDTHIGADPVGYHQQENYLQHLSSIMDALKQAAEEFGAECIVHGGDMVDTTDRQQIDTASQQFDIGIPTVLCLGNHDLTETDALTTWLDAAPQFFPDGTPETRLVLDDCVIHVVPNHWNATTPFYWDPTEQSPRFSDAQLDMLKERLGEHTDRPHILSTHAQAAGLPVAQTGMDEPYHTSPEDFENTIRDLYREFPHIQCVLGAHSHLNLHVERDGVNLVTSSSLLEVPFDIKLFDVTPERMTMSTLSLDTLVSFETQYDFNKTYVQGRPCDRAFDRTL